ncbi:ribonuclease H-like domain-containing protein [Bacillus sp. FJAT-29790]|uniref:ribonuclease H-like domain-containing protein n=1 Tax=Bacillus sp. FJAT-29790 TaxID=1895002 RepID=UPI001C235B79|nr:ribonuclease H-like domain-containing protein [Bacillus sp. FJAT-29790]MBU8879051.1 ribonuclease H-like domain-containing protein [Bacillus sp. FJAT-29790]
MSIKNKLNRLKSHLSHESSNKTELISIPSVEIEEIPFRETWESEGVHPFFFDGSYCLVREREFSLQQKHGIYSFAEFSAAVDAWHSSEVNHPLSAAGHQPENLFFFDTETTGLGGGVGNSIFILGHASLTENKIKLKQHILPNPGAEVPLYKSFLESVNYTTMVTYNGKSFDWPQVKTRHTLIREHLPKLPSFGHFDLYHAARRMWKHKLERTKLSVVEKEVLGIERKDDIPGYLAPMIYFDFVERKDPHGMLGILEHNENDILSLISLYTHLSFQLLGLDRKQTGREVYEVGRWFSQLGETSAAQSAFAHISNGNEREAIDAKHALAFEYKKQKNWMEAARLWEAVTEKGHHELKLAACIELAKIYEHREKDLKKAILYSEKAKVFYKEALTKKCEKIKVSQEEIEKRIQRLLKKID